MHLKNITNINVCNLIMKGEKMSKFETLLEKLCPNGVEYKTLGELGRFYGGITGKSKEDFKDGNAKFITYKNVYENISLKLDVEDKVKISEKENQRTLEYGDIIFTGSSETPNECGLSSVVTEKVKEKLYLNSFCFFFRMNNKETLNPDFAKHLFRSSNLRYQIGKTASGVTRFNVSKKAMEKVRIPVPPLEVQCEIVHILDDFTILSAELSAELKARQKQFNFYRESLISQNYEKIVRLKDICDIKGRIGFRGYTRNDLVEKGQGAISFSPGNITNETINYDKCTYISWEKYEESPEIMINNGDVILCKTGSTLGKVAQVKDLPEKATLNPQLVVLKNLKCNSTYLKYIIGSYDFQTAMQAKKGLGSVPNISQKDIGNIEIRLHSKENQGKIARILERLDNLCNSISEGLPAEIEARQKQYEYYRDKLLTFKELKVNE